MIRIARPPNGQHDSHVELYEREAILRSDMYSPLVKGAMKRFWARCDELDRQKGEENARHHDRH
jgi:hypothetical protein